jgi:hypothetical protein
VPPAGQTGAPAKKWAGTGLVSTVGLENSKEISASLPPATGTVSSSLRPNHRFPSRRGAGFSTSRSSASEDPLSLTSQPRISRLRLPERIAYPRIALGVSDCAQGAYSEMYASERLSFDFRDDEPQRPSAIGATVERSKLFHSARGPTNGVTRSEGCAQAQRSFQTLQSHDAVAEVSKKSLAQAASAGDSPPWRRAKHYSYPQSTVPTGAIDFAAAAATTGKFSISREKMLQHREPWKHPMLGSAGRARGILSDCSSRVFVRKGQHDIAHVVPPSDSGTFEASGCGASVPQLAYSHHSTAGCAIKQWNTLMKPGSEDLSAREDVGIPSQVGSAKDTNSRSPGNAAVPTIQQQQQCGAPTRAHCL